MTQTAVDAAPRSVLMIKAHSVGVGDLLRSSAAWRTLKNHWPDAQLHLLFLTKQQGYATEELIGQHHLLSSCHFVTIRSGSPHEQGASNVPLKAVLAQVKQVCAQVKPDVVIDFEASGLRTSLVTRYCAKWTGARSVGVANFPLRRWFYDDAAPSVARYASVHGLSLPMDYTERDYVVLAALGLERSGQAIELQVQPAGLLAKEKLRNDLNARLRVNSSMHSEAHRDQAHRTLLVGLNIGCGTPDARHKRPKLDVLVDAIGRLYQQTPFTLVLTGAAYERDINQQFIAAYRGQWGDAPPVVDWAGEVSISGLTGVMEAVDYFISTDSGPYHMAVALRKPTLVLFTYPEVTSYHNVPWCTRLIAPYDAQQMVMQFQQLQAYDAAAYR